MLIDVLIYMVAQISVRGMETFPSVQETSGSQYKKHVSNISLSLTDTDEAREHNLIDAKTER